MPVYVVLEIPTEEEVEGGTDDSVFLMTRDAVEGLMRAQGMIVSEHDASIAQKAAMLAVGFTPTAFHMAGKSWNVEPRPRADKFGMTEFTVIYDEEEPTDG